jgi:hypothetical protein
VACSFKHGYEPVDSIKGGEFLDQLSDYQLSNIASVLWSYLVSW